MTEEQEILIAKAAGDCLAPAEQRRWAELCRAHPELEEEARQMREASAGLAGMIRAAEKRAADELPDELPPYLRASLESARREIFPQAREVKTGFWKRLAGRMESLVPLPAPVLAGFAAMAIVAGGWWITAGKERPPGGLALAPTIFKAPVSSPGLPLVSPGKVTGLLDPDIVWLPSGIAGGPATVEVLDSAGVSLATVAAPGASLPWSTLAERSPRAGLAPGASYLIRVKAGDFVSERVFQVAAGAISLETAAADPGATETARRWLADGRAADALALAKAVAVKARAAGGEPLSALTDLRERALREALRQASAEAGEK